MYHLGLPRGWWDAPVPVDGNRGAQAVAVEGLGHVALEQVVECAPDVLHLRRERVFKGEALVPVVPTAYCVVVFPALDRNESMDAIAAKVTQYLAHRVATAPTAAARQLVTVPDATECPRYSLFIDRSSGSVVLLCDLSRVNANVSDVYDPNNVVLALLDAVQSCSTPFDADRSSQFPFAASCDPRPETYDAAPQAWFSLPLCLMCLDRLDRLISGVTGPGMCRCPCSRCRCQPASTACRCCTAFRNSSRGNAERVRCDDCGAADDLWACLDCGRVGCSRYREEHAKAHGEHQMHPFALSLLTQQIWDYDADGLAHRLVITSYNSEHGTSELFEFPQQGDYGAGAAAAVAVRKLGGHPEATSVSASVGAAAGKPPKSKTKGGEDDFSEAKHIVDAKTEAKVEDACFTFARQMALQLEAQRQSLIAHFGAAGRDDGDGDSQRRSPSPRDAAAAPSRYAVGTIAESVELYAMLTALDVTREAETWSHASLRACRLPEKLRQTEAEARELEEQLRALAEEEDRLKARMKDELHQRHASHEAKRQRIRELNEMIAEAQLNLDARARVHARGLSAQDQATSFVAATQRGRRR